MGIVRTILIGSCLAAMTALGGCVDTGEDSNTDVFVTADHVKGQRIKEQHHGWQELSLTLLASERPGLSAKAQDENAVEVQADGVTRKISLVGAYEGMAAHPNQERSILRKYLQEQLRPFDFERLRALGFEKVRAHLLPMLVNRAQLEAMIAAADAADKPTATPIVTNLFRVTVVNWETFGVVPVTAAALGGTATQAQIDEAGMENLAALYRALPKPRIATEFGSTWGRLQGTSQAAVILLPEFAEDARKLLGTTGDLVLIAPTRQEIDVTPRDNQKMVDQLVWMGKEVLTRGAVDPLFDGALVLDGRGLSLLSQTPATVPVTKPATRHFIVE